MQKIIPYLWFEKNAKEAAEFYTSVFKNSEVSKVVTLHNTPSGDAAVVSFKLDGQDFVSLRCERHDCAQCYFFASKLLHFLSRVSPQQ